MQGRGRQNGARPALRDATRARLVRPGRNPTALLGIRPLSSLKKGGFRAGGQTKGE